MSFDDRRLVVVSGGAPPSQFPILPTINVVGRIASADLRLDVEGVSRRHAIIDATGSQVILSDVGSTNGTRVNGHRLAGPHPLCDGDLVEFGGVELRFTDTGQPSPATGNLGAQHASRGISGSQFAAHRDQSIAARDQYLAGRDQNWKNSIKIRADYEPIDELFQGSGPGRWIGVLGALVALVGFGYFMLAIFSAADAGTSRPDPGLFAPGFGAFAVGGIVLAIGIGMSKARRKRGRR